MPGSPARHAPEIRLYKGSSVELPLAVVPSYRVLLVSKALKAPSARPRRVYGYRNWPCSRRLGAAMTGLEASAMVIDLSTRKTK